MRTGTGEDLLRDNPALREAFRRGEKRALASVCKEYLPLVRIIVREGFAGFRGFRSQADQDDMTQTILLAAFEESARDRYDGITPYSAYLRGIAHNKIRQQLSKNARFARVDGAPIPCDRLAEDFEGVVLEREACVLMARFRESVTNSEERRILTRYFVDGAAEETLSAELGITRYQIRKIIKRLHTQMQRYLRKHNVVVS